MNKILVIEDEKSVRTSIRDLLIEKQFEVYLADGGKEGLNLAREITPDLIICDIMMNDMDGYMVIENLKKSVATSNIPFLFLTAKADAADLRKGMGLGADDYLFKPFKAKDLLQAIELRLAKKKESENKFKQIWEHSRDGMCLIDSHGKICIVNDAFCHLLRKSKEELIHREFNAYFQSEGINIKSITEPVEISERMILWNGVSRYFSFSFSPFESFDSSDNLLCILRDITVKKENEDKLISSLKEKDVLLKEIHHRVKNNLQIISSLLSLQSNYLLEEDVKEIFLESQNRIRSMSLIHEKLYQSNNLSEIDFKDYIQELSNYLVISYNLSSFEVDILLNIDSIKCHIDTAIPLGIIFNELITNSIKHAFQDVEQGVIEIRASKKEDQIVVSYSDNGNGLPDDFSIENISSLGFSLITNLAEQLSAKLEIENSDHFSIKLSVPIKF